LGKLGNDWNVYMGRGKEERESSIIIEMRSSKQLREEYSQNLRFLFGKHLSARSRRERAASGSFCLNLNNPYLIQTFFESLYFFVIVLRRSSAI
jgi:hypothetical protein